MIRRLLVAMAATVALAGCAAPGYSPAATVDPIVAAAPTATATPTPDRPVSIEIPTLGVTDDIVPVGLAADGSMEVPPVEHSGWYRLGPKPGAVGPATVIGHVDYRGVKGALGRIGELHSGDQIVVSDAAGTVWVFTVYAVAKIPKEQFKARTIPLVFGPTTGPELRVVTCSGTVNNGQYSDNTIASARLRA